MMLSQIRRIKMKLPQIATTPVRKDNYVKATIAEIITGASKAGAQIRSRQTQYAAAFIAFAGFVSFRPASHGQLAARRLRDPKTLNSKP